VTFTKKESGVTRARILLADDHQELRELVVQLLETDFEILQSVGDGRAFLKAALELKPDLCLVDISMPFVNGLEAAAQLKDAGSTARVIILTIHEDLDFVRASFRNGASGYVVKSRIGSDLLAAVKEVLAGRTFISSSVNFSTTSLGP
jgi:DNA-binding NarL/FixJ family response regulator